MRRRLAWGVAIPLALAGSEAAHALAYALVYPQAHVRVLALGNGDVTLIELANGYRALANGGEWRPWTWRLTSDASRGPARGARRVISPAASAIVLDILSDPAARIPGFGTSTP